MILGFAEGKEIIDADTQRISGRHHANFSILHFMFFCTIISYICASITFAANDSQVDLELQNGWIDCGGSSWYLNKTAGQNLSLLLQSGPIENSGVSKICRIVEGPARIRFWWKTDANYRNIGQLYFLVNGERKYKCDSRSGKYETYEIRYAGNYILTWEFMKYKSYPQNFGSGWVGDIQIDAKAKKDLNDDRCLNETMMLINDSSFSELIKSLHAKFLRVHLDQHDDPINGTFASIYLAQYAVEDGGFIEVNDINLNENIVLYKPINLIGNITYGTNLSSHGIYILSDNVSVKNIVIKNYVQGFFIQNVSNISLENNSIRDCIYGIYLTNCNSVKAIGNFIESIKDSCIMVENTINGTINENIMDKSQIGIAAVNSFDNNFSDNTFYNMVDGIKIRHDCKNISLYGNNYTNISSCDIFLEDESRVKDIEYPKNICKPNPCPGSGDKCKCINCTIIT